MKTAILVVAGLLCLGRPQDATLSPMVKSSIYDIEGVQRKLREGGTSYLEFLDVPSLSVGVYELPAGGEDKQSPHERDEIYYVLEGAASFIAAGERRSVRKGDVIYVRREVEHRFLDIKDDLSLLVIFAPGTADG